MLHNDQRSLSTQVDIPHGSTVKDFPLKLQYLRISLPLVLRLPGYQPPQAPTGYSLLTALPSCHWGFPRCHKIA